MFIVNVVAIRLFRTNIYLDTNLLITYADMLLLQYAFVDAANDCLIALAESTINPNISRDTFIGDLQTPANSAAVGAVALPP